MCQGPLTPPVLYNQHHKKMVCYLKLNFLYFVKKTEISLKKNIFIDRRNV